jgi:hypothetical protein
LASHELAARLSYFLWNSAPDAELLNAAKAGAIAKDPSTQVERMLSDAKVSRFIDRCGPANTVRPERNHTDNRGNRKKRNADQDDPQGRYGKPHVPAPLQAVRVAVGMAVVDGLVLNGLAVGGLIRVRTVFVVVTHHVSA